jgi:hypothetical protein
LFNDKIYSPLTQIEYSANRTSIKEKESQLNRQRSKETTNIGMHTNANLSPLTSFLNNSRKPVDRGSLITSQQNPINHQTTSNRQLSPTSTIQYATSSCYSPSSLTSSSQKRTSRRPDSFAEKKRIEKRDISCPFRCSCIDLNIAPSPLSQDLNNNNMNNEIDVLNKKNGANSLTGSLVVSPPPKHPLVGDSSSNIVQVI